MMVLFVPSWNTIQNFHFILANKIFNFWMGSFKSIADYWATKQWDMLELACVTPSFQFYLHFNALRWSNLQFFLFEHLMQCRLLLLAQQNEIKNLLCAHFKCLSTWLSIFFIVSFDIEIFSTKNSKKKRIIIEGFKPILCAKYGLNQSFWVSKCWCLLPNEIVLQPSCSILPFSG